MNHLKLLIILLIATITLDAAYLRTIRVGAFKTEAIAQKQYKKLNQFIHANANIMALKDEWGFEAIMKKSGKYYITVVEPLTDKKALQEVIDTLRQKYPDAYVKKLEKSNIKVKEVEEELPKEVIEEIQMPADTMADEDIVEIEKVSEIEEEKVVIEEKKEIELPSQVEPVVIIKEKIKEVIVEKEVAKIDTTWKILFFILLVFFLVALVLLYIGKKKIIKEGKKERNRKLRNDEKDMEFSSHMQNNANFLSQAQTSMSSVIQYSNLLLELELSVIQKDYVRRIKNSSEGLLNVINNTSDISKIQVGELHISNVDFNLRNMINDVMNIIAFDAKQNNVKLELDIPEEIPSHIIGDSVHLKQVLVSLLTNSVKYTRDGEVTLTLKKVYSYAHAITLSFIVNDTGIGMSPQLVESIVYASKNNNATNLSVSKQLIQKMNGDLKIYSTLDIGTTFTFNIKFDLKQ